LGYLLSPTAVPDGLDRVSLGLEYLAQFGKRDRQTTLPLRVSWVGYVALLEKQVAKAVVEKEVCLCRHVASRVVRCQSFADF